MNDEQENAGPRRLQLRRSLRGAGGSSFSTPGTGRVDSIRDSHEADEVDDAIEPIAINDRVRGRVGLPAPAVTPDEAREDPRARLNEVAMAGSPAYAKEYRLNMIHRLLMRNTPLDQIARQLQVSVSTIEKDRAELRRRLRQQATELNIDEMVGGQNALYDEIAGMSLRLASSRDVPVAMKLASMRTALAANADRSRFLNAAGVFDVLRFRRAETGEDVSDVQALMRQTMELMQSLDEPEQPMKKAVRRKRPGGFAPMTFDDADASGSDREVQEL